MRRSLDRTLSLWIDVEVQIAKIHSPWTDKRTLLRSVLLEFEERGLASRHLRSDGKIGWRATPKMHGHIREAELDAVDDLGCGD